VDPNNGVDRSYKNWSQSKKKTFTKFYTKWADDLGKKEIEKDLNQVRIIIVDCILSIL
jgi:hypothetical protein